MLISSTCVAARQAHFAIQMISAVYLSPVSPRWLLSNKFFSRGGPLGFLAEGSRQAAERRGVWHLVGIGVA